MTTIKDIARISGYSIGTVSRVINNHPDVSAIAKKKIEKVIKELPIDKARRPDGFNGLF